MEAIEKNYDKFLLNNNWEFSKDYIFKSKISKEVNKKACDSLSKNRNTTEVLMVYFMSALDLSPVYVRYLKFNDAIIKTINLLLKYIIHKIRNTHIFLFQNLYTIK